tara:strand:+ start:2038 stop:2571 length:534 start_codon:yes stop_codon:yes gene_type:complete
MKTDNIERYLNSFGRQVVNRAKSNLQKAKGGGTAIEQSIHFEVVTDSDGFTVNFYMTDYGTFLDKGVSGNKQQQKFKDYKNKVIASPYKYTTKQPPPSILAKWISKKGIKGRDKKSGRFISNLSLAFIIGRAIKRDGIKSLSFFQKPLGLGLKQFGKDLLGNVKQDIINELNKTTVN